MNWRLGVPGHGPRRPSSIDNSALTASAVVAADACTATAVDLRSKRRGCRCVGTVATTLGAKDEEQDFCGSGRERAWLCCRRPPSAAEPTQVERVQAALDAWLAVRAPDRKGHRHRRLHKLRRYRAGDRGLRRESGPRPRRRPRRPGHALPYGKHVEVVHRSGDPQARSGGKALDRRHARQMAAGVSGVEGRHHPPPPQYDERYSHLFRDRVDVAGVGERAHAGFHPQGAGRCRLSKRHQSSCR